MKDKDLIYIGIIAFLGYFLLNRNKNKGVKVTDTKINPVGNTNNGGLNLPSNMDLPNLTPTPLDGLATEDALNQSNINPLVKDNEPTQVYGSYNLPTPYSSNVITNPAQAQEIVSNQNLPTTSTSIIINPPILEAQPTTNTNTIVNPPILEAPPTTNTSAIINPPILEAQPTKANEINETPIIKGISLIRDPFSLTRITKSQIATELPIKSEEVYTKL